MELLLRRTLVLLNSESSVVNGEYSILTTDHSLLQKVHQSFERTSVPICCFDTQIAQQAMLYVLLQGSKKIYLILTFLHFNKVWLRPILSVSFTISKPALCMHAIKISE